MDNLFFYYFIHKEEYLEQNVTILGKRRKPNRRPIRRRPQNEHRINHRIRSHKVRVVGLEDSSKNGIYTLSEALRMAEERSMDLVEIVATANPPVCRITDYSKFKYELKKKKKLAQAKQQTVTMKEIRFGPNTDTHDFNFKLKHAEKFLSEGHKLRAYVHFRGRSILYTNRGRALLDEFVEKLSEVGKVEVRPKMEGKRMVIIMSPKKNLKKNPAPPKAKPEKRGETKSRSEKPLVNEKPPVSEKPPVKVIPPRKDTPA